MTLATYYVPDVRLIYTSLFIIIMTSRKKVPVSILAMFHLRMAVMHLPTNFCANSSIQFGVIDIFRNTRRRPPPSWIFNLCEFGHSGVLIGQYLCSVPNLVQLQIYVIVTEIDIRHTYASDLNLMTSRELTSGFDFWSRDHLRVAFVHLPI